LDFSFLGVALRGGGEKGHRITFYGVYVLSMRYRHHHILSVQGVMKSSTIMIHLFLWATLFLEAMAQRQTPGALQNYLPIMADYIQNSMLGLDHCGMCAICSECEYNLTPTCGNPGLDQDSSISTTCPNNSSDVTGMVFWACLCLNPPGDTVFSTSLNDCYQNSDSTSSRENSTFVASKFEEICFSIAQSILPAMPTIPSLVPFATQTITQSLGITSALGSPSTSSASIVPGANESPGLLL
jgi:hypothetical protein